MRRSVDSRVTKASRTVFKAFGLVLNPRGAAGLATVDVSYVTALLAVIWAYRRAYAITEEDRAT